MIDPQVVAERSAEAWSHLYLASFLTRMAEGLGPGCSADFHQVFSIFMDKAQSGYRQREIGPRSLAPIILLMKFGLILTDHDIEPKLKRHVMIVICQAVQDEAMKREPGVTDRACLASLSSVLYRPLMGAWKLLIEFCYSAYKEPLERVKSGSTSFATWEDAVRDIWPLLYLSKIIPTHDVQYMDRVQVPDPDTYGKVPATYTNEIRTPRLLYTRLFSPAELQAHSDEQKMIDEVYAHLTATLGLIRLCGEHYFEDIRKEVFAIEKKKGRVAARQYVQRLNTHNLSIPRFFTDQLVEELRSLASGS